ncbi:hypothetical protein SLA2020_415660 [Shorea laevis]
MLVLIVASSTLCIAGNEIVADVESKDNVDKDKSNVEEPKQGMTFSSLDEVNFYYKSYAKQEGFGVVQKKNKKNKNGDVDYVNLGCARQGSRKSNSSNSFSKPIQTIRTGCKASLNAKLVDTKWSVTSVCIDHNHALSPSKARHFRCHKKLDSSDKTTTE